MVSFICNACGQSVRKNQVEKHYKIVCRQCEVLSCIDCGKDFHGEEYAQHTSCISEAEKYQGKLFKPKDKQNKGEQKQQEWIKQVQEASQAGMEDPQIRKILHRLKQYSNIPRKKAKFQNFCRNSVSVTDQAVLDKLWEIFSGGEKGSVEGNGQTTEDSIASSDKATDSCSGGESQEHEEDKEGAKQAGEVFNGDTGEANLKKMDKKDKRRKQKHGGEEVEAVPGEIKSKKKRKGDKETEDSNHNRSEVKSTKKKGKRQRGDSKGGSSEVSLDVKKKKESEQSDNEEENSEDIQETPKGNFKWASVIKKVLQEAPDNELPVKRLRKKVLAEFEARGGDNKPYTDNELRAIFDKKLNKNPKFKVQKERAKLCK